MLLARAGHPVAAVVHQPRLPVTFRYHPVTRYPTAHQVVHSSLCPPLRQRLVVGVAATAVRVARQLDLQRRVIAQRTHQLIQHRRGIRPDVVLIKVIIDIFQFKGLANFENRLQQQKPGAKSVYNSETLTNKLSMIDTAVRTSSVHPFILFEEGDERRRRQAGDVPEHGRKLAVCCESAFFG